MNNKFKFYYGILLVFVGLCIFYRMPELIQQTEQIEFFKQKITGVKFCFYMLGVFLVVAGGIRIKNNFSSLKGETKGL